MGQTERRSGDQSQYHQAVFDVVACLQRMVPVVECLSDGTAKANQQEQKRAELKKLLPHGEEP